MPFTNDPASILYDCDHSEGELRYGLAHNAYTIIMHSGDSRWLRAGRGGREDGS